MRRASRVCRALAIVAAACAACTAPPEPDRTRPEAVRTTPFARHDRMLVGLRVRMIDEGPLEAPAPGGAAPVVALIPGHTSRIEEYDGLVPVLARCHPVLVLDSPGARRSLAAGITAELAAALEEFLARPETALPAAPGSGG